ncbi:hypothetical protein XNA1_4730021 [Xenorhabdus nematophila str. Anatoliense]|nr:hypothetical protein XNA1_4730021 [Xenorhabdus nematophila str. Anatoliense]
MYRNTCSPFQATGVNEQLSFTLNFKPCGMIRPTVYWFLSLH